VEKSPARPTLQDVEVMLTNAKAQLEKASPEQKALWEEHIRRLEQTLEKIKTRL
jgi:hypothetical protein